MESSSDSGSSVAVGPRGNTGFDDWRELVGSSVGAGASTSEDPLGCVSLGLVEADLVGLVVPSVSDADPSVVHASGWLWTSSS